LTLPALVAMADELYRSAVTEPDRWNEAAFAEWIDAAAAAAPEASPEEVRALRRVVRMAMRLATFWSSPAAGGHAGETEWMARVDLAAGPPAWRPTLDLGEAALAADPSPELFRHVAERFRLVTNQPFLGGAGFDEWLAGPRDASAGDS